MTTPAPEELKSEVADYWNNQPCGTHVVSDMEFSREYSDAIEAHRYTVEPNIFSFAQFTRWRGQKLLEVGVGAGTDFIQWVRAGTQAHGIDLTKEGIELVQKRLEVYGLQAEKLQVADCENIPYPDNSFDIVYSWGVIHHTPDTPKAFREIVRVCRPGGTCKIMVYHRRSLLTFFFWVQKALLRGKPWMSFAKVLWNHMESIGTKAYIPSEIREILKNQPIENLKIKPVLTYYDRMERFSAPLRLAGKIAAYICGGDPVGWFLTIEFTKKA